MKHCPSRAQPRRWVGRALTPARLLEAGWLYSAAVNLASVGVEFGVDRRFLRRVFGIGVRSDQQVNSAIPSG
jgi:hypothetical protein